MVQKHIYFSNTLTQVLITIFSKITILWIVNSLKLFNFKLRVK